MIGKVFRTASASIIVAAGLATTLTAAAATIDMDGTIFLSGGGASPVGRCAPALTIDNDSWATYSNLGNFHFVSSECINPPPPTTTFDGLFTFDFANGSVFGTTYSALTESGTPSVFNIDGLFVVTGGTGDFLGATGELSKRGTLDRRHFPPDATALIAFAGSVNVVPEPETCALMLAGLTVVAFVARRRRSTLA